LFKKKEALIDNLIVILFLSRFILSSAFVLHKGSSKEDETKRLDLAFDIFDVCIFEVSFNHFSPYTGY
jgi:hypothetical protein